MWCNAASTFVRKYFIWASLLQFIWHLFCEHLVLLGFLLNHCNCHFIVFGLKTYLCGNRLLHILAQQNIKPLLFDGFQFIMRLLNSWHWVISAILNAIFGVSIFWKVYSTTKYQLRLQYIITVMEVEKTPVKEWNIALQIFPCKRQTTFFLAYMSVLRSFPSSNNHHHELEFTEYEFRFTFGYFFILAYSIPVFRIFIHSGFICLEQSQEILQYFPSMRVNLKSTIVLLVQKRIINYSEATSTLGFYLSNNPK